MLPQSLRGILPPKPGARGTPPPELPTAAQEWRPPRPCDAAPLRGARAARRTGKPPRRAGSSKPAPTPGPPPPPPPNTAGRQPPAPGAPVSPPPPAPATAATAWRPLPRGAAAPLRGARAARWTLTPPHGGSSWPRPAPCRAPHGTLVSVHRNARHGPRAARASPRPLRPTWHAVLQVRGASPSQRGARPRGRLPAPPATAAPSPPEPSPCSRSARPVPGSPPWLLRPVARLPLSCLPQTRRACASSSPRFGCHCPPTGGPTPQCPSQARLPALAAPPAGWRRRCLATWPRGTAPAAAHAGRLPPSPHGTATSRPPRRCVAAAHSGRPEAWPPTPSRAR
mmetsp:Transcript_72119/g.215180  ORF Transcript_72119/g.215180 Transcript_72119/m.215180 type:complete len:339 (-) Transcript_72119:394-1410(-)